MDILVRPTSPTDKNVYPTSPMDKNVHPTSPTDKNVQPTSPKDKNVHPTMAVSPQMRTLRETQAHVFLKTANPRRARCPDACHGSPSELWWAMSRQFREREVGTVWDRKRCPWLLELAWVRISSSARWGREEWGRSTGPAIRAWIATWPSRSCPT